MGRALSRPLRVSGRLISNLPRFFHKGALNISCFPHTEALSGRDKVRPPHLTRETVSGRRPADGAIPPAESFVLAKIWPWGGGEDKVSGCRLNPSLISEVLSSLAARCISQSGSVLRRLYLRPQPHTTIIPPGRKTHIHTPPPRPLAVPAASSPA